MSFFSWRLAVGVISAAAISGVGINLYFNAQRMTTNAINLSKLGKIQLQQLTSGDGAYTTVNANSLWDNSKGVCILTVRRPGCLLCREEAKQLVQLYEKQKFDKNNIKLIGIVKETLGTTEFNKEYFPYPIYLDCDMSFYEQVNGRRMGLWGFLVPQVWNNIWCSQRKGFQGNVEGEGTILGGVICVKNGNEIIDKSMLLRIVCLLLIERHIYASFIPLHGTEKRHLHITDFGPLHHHDTINTIITTKNSNVPIKNPLNSNIQSNNPLIYVTDFGADPYGINDSTTAFEDAINSALKRGASNTYLADNITDLGGVTIDLGGGDYKISKSLRIPPMYGNLRIIDGTIRASETFSPISTYLLYIGEENYNCSNNQGSCNENIGIENIMFDCKQICYGVLHIINTMGAVIGPQIFVLGYNNAGITVTVGHETMIFNAWLGEYLYSDKRKRSANATSIQLFGSDAYITNTIIFAGKIGVHCKGWANVIEGVHTWNDMTSAGGTGILLENSMNIRLLHNYMDYNDMVLTAPIGDISVRDTHFLGGGTLVLKATTTSGVIDSLNLVDSIYANGKFSGNTTTVVLDETNGIFTKVNNIVIKGIQVLNHQHYSVKTTYVKRSLTLMNATEWKFDFNDILLFDSIGIKGLQYTLQMHVNSKSIFVQHEARVGSNNGNVNESRIVTVYTSKPCDATVYIEVDQSNYESIYG